MLAGEVLQTLDGGALLIGIGRHRVPAQGHVALEEGHRFLFVVEGEGEEVVLRILGEDRPGEPALLRALRGVLGQDLPLARLLASLARTLEAGEAARTLAGQIAAHVARPGDVGAALAEQLGRAGLGYEARLASAAALSLPATEAAQLARELESWLLGRLTDPGPGAGAAGTPSGPELLAALRAQVAELLGAGASLPGREAAFASWLSATLSGGGDQALASGDLQRLLAAALERLADGEGRAALLARLQASPLSSLGRGLEVLLVRRLLGLESAPAALQAEELRATVELAGSDLKAQLLQAMSTLADGPEREAVARALSGLEAEQLLNVARREAHEARHWSLPLVDGGALDHGAPVHRARPPGEGSSDAQPGQDTWRLSLSVEFTRTGPLRADLLARPGEIVVRVLASRPEVTAALASDLEPLRARLELGGRRALVSVATAPAAALRVEGGTADVRYLREHHLMDVSA